MSEERAIHMSGIFKGILFSALATLLCLVLLTAVCYFGTVSDQLLGVLVFASTVLCVFLGALFVSGRARKNGLAHGALLGGGYFLVVWLISVWVRHGVFFDLHLLTLLAGIVSGGMLGGVLGVNTKN